MYNFADETPDYINVFDTRLSVRHEEQEDWRDWHTEHTPARPILPSGYADERLICLEPGALSDGWERAQIAQVIGSTFGDLFHATHPNYEEIKALALTWYASLYAQWGAQPERREELQIARILLAGVAETAERGARGQCGRWWPSKAGYHAARPEAPEAAEAAEAAEPGAWYVTRDFAHGAHWKVRAIGADAIEARPMEQPESAHHVLTKKQARACFESGKKMTKLAI